MINRLPTAFHETFPLKRIPVSQVFEVLVAESDPSILSSKSRRESLLREMTPLGRNYVKAMPYYVRGAGLLDDAYSITEVGNWVRQYDPTFDQVSTQWLIHYHMSANQGPGPEFWNSIVLQRFRAGNSFSKAAVEDDLAQIYIGINGRPPSQSTLQGTRNAFTNTYTDTDCLGRLEILSTGPDKEFRVGMPVSPDAWVFLYALIDHWDFYFGNRVSINLDELTSETGLASLFLLDNSRLNRILSELQQAGFVDIYRSAQPYQLLLLSHDKTAALHNLYGISTSI
jgi:hypothetical protein